MSSIITGDETWIYGCYPDMKKCQSGRCHHSLSWWKRGKSSQNSRQWWLLCVTGKVWCITNFIPMVRTWIRLSMEPFCKSLKMQYIGNSLPHGLQYNAFAFNQCIVLSPGVSGNYWPGTASHSFPTCLNQIWLFASSSSSPLPGWRSHLSGKDWKTLQWIWHGSWRLCRNSSTTDALKSRRITKITA
jgi:hypothetical protein